MGKKDKQKRGKLYIVSTHIGNREDMTLRAIEILKLCDLVVCEDIKVGTKILKEQNIYNKIDTMNEQNESDKVIEFIQMIKDGKKLAVISDCGTPIFADPGNELLRNALLCDIDIIVVPGVSSLMTALVRSGMPLNQFLYAGFPPRNSKDRHKFFQELSREPRTVVVYDTPYRLVPVLEEACKVMPYRNMYLGMNLTMPFETNHYGTFTEVYDKLKNERIKAEFVIVFEGMNTNTAVRSFEDDDFDSEDSTDKTNKRERRYRDEIAKNRRRERTSVGKKRDFTKRNSQTNDKKINKHSDDSKREKRFSKDRNKKRK